MYDQEQTELDVAQSAVAGNADDVPEARRELVKKIQKNVTAAKEHHKEAFKRMRDDMEAAKDGTTQVQFKGGKKYVLNLINSFLRSRTAALYAKNPKASFARRPRRNFTVWDGNISTVMSIAEKQIMGLPMQPTETAVLQDYIDGMARTKMYENMGDTLVKVFNYYLKEQKPKTKTQMKQLVRRVLTCGVGYIKIGYQRELQRRATIQAQIDDITLKMQNMQRIVGEMQAGELQDDNPDMEVLRLQLQQLENDPGSMEVIREGMIFDFPRSTQIIVDTACENLNGFIGAEWIAEENYYQIDTIRELFDIDLKNASFNKYQKGKSGQFAKYNSEYADRDASCDFACVWTYYCKKTGMQYTIIDGYCDFAEEPGKPNVEVEGFWPIYTLMFNMIEDEKEIYPKSDVHHLLCIQDEWNRSREGLREHRQAARPRYVAPKGQIDDKDKAIIQGTSAHSVAEISMTGDQDVRKLIQRVPTDGLDSNLYTTNHLMEDMELAVGGNQNSLGGTSRGTATAAQISQSSTMSSLESNMDDLDDLLTEIARDGSQVLLLNMTKQQAIEIAGEGAVWHEGEAQRAEVVKELYLEIEAGSSGRPNSASDLANLERAVPLLLQIPGVKGQRLAEEIIKIMFNGKYDVKDFMEDNALSIVAQNAMKAPVAAGAGVVEGGAQGPQGANSAAEGMPSAPGSTAPMGGNNMG